MIDVRELRIGNWVIDRYTPTNTETFVQVLGMHLINGHGSINASSDNGYFPIPLSPSILEKCGFTKPTWNTFTYDIGKLSICLPGNQYRDGRVYFNSWCIMEDSIKSLHQLQNLYYALTQTELKIQL